MKQLFANLQEAYVFWFRGSLALFRRPLYLRDTVVQMERDGADSLLIVAAVAVFVGMALSLQITAELSFLGLQMYAGRIIGISIVSEIGPVLTAVVFAGRAGSGAASELGSMVLGNQVNALRVFGVDPLKKLVAPRILSSLIMVPALTIIGDAAAMLGGLYVAVVLHNQSAIVYLQNVRLVFVLRYMLPGLIKPLVFGYVIACVSTFEGMIARGGALGLKHSTTRSFVLCTILIILLDFAITRVILILLE